ncbi:MAG: cobalamin-dependent protein, partial [Halieaceae bacterium]
MKRPVWLLSMDSEQFNAPPTTTAGLSSYYRKTGQRSDETDIDLVHFQAAEEINPWLQAWQENDLPRAEQAVQENLAPVIGFSFYTWNAAEFLDLLSRMKALLPGALFVAGGPHVQQVEDYLGVDPLDVIFVGEAEISFREFLDCKHPNEWQRVDGLAYLEQGQL